MGFRESLRILAGLLDKLFIETLPLSSFEFLRVPSGSLVFLWFSWGTVGLSFGFLGVLWGSLGLFGVL